MALPERGPAGVSEQPKLSFPDGSLFEYPVWTGVKEELRTPDLSFDMPKRKLKPEIPQVLKNIYHRGNLEGLGTALGIDVLSTAYLWLSIPALTAVINTAASVTDAQLAIPTALTAGGILGLKSLKKDAQTLRDKHFGTNTIGTAAYAMTGKPRVSAAIDHILGYSFVAVGNPVGIFSLLSDKSLLPLDLLATSIALPAWYLLFNSLIDKGKFDRFIKPVKEKRHAISDEIKHVIKG
jgi:hypothetical protein